MAAYKQERAYTVSSVYDRECNKERPAIRICGDWLRELGFEKGKRILIQCEGGRLTVELANEIRQEEL